MIEEPATMTTRRTGIAVALAALFAAIAIPGNPPGLGISLVALAVAGAVVLGRGVEGDLTTTTYCALSLLLASMATIRAAEWVVGADLLAATGLAAVAVARAVRWREVLYSPLTVVRRFGGGVRLAVAALPAPGFSRRLGPVLRGAALSAVLLIVFGSLFASADRAFAELARDLVPDLDLGLLPARLFVFGAILMGTGALIITGRRALATGTGDIEESTRKGLGRNEWLTALGLLDALFLAFVVVQITVFFGGSEHVLDTTGLTFAEYARQGFFQLIAVGALTFAVIAGAVRWASLGSKRETLMLQVLLGLLGLLTGVVLVSAMRRLSLYESVFGYTTVRISAHALIFWMAGVLALILVAGIRMRGAWLPRATLILSALALLAFTLSNPEGLVAERNVSRFERTGRFDIPYARTLGADAVPALAALPPGMRCSALAPQTLRLARPDPLMGWNLGRQQARKTVAEFGGSMLDCDGSLV